MDSIAESLKNYLPNQKQIKYSPVGRCIYCGETTNLTVEHIIPYGLGGRLELPKSSCKKCSTITGNFERTCLRTMYGPLRLLYDLPSRRKKLRPNYLPLKVKRKPGDEWTYINVEQEKYPFLILFPFFVPPKILTADMTLHGATSRRFWIRGASPSYIFKNLLQRLTEELKVHSVMPEAKAEVSKFCQMLAKISYSFAVGELGIATFNPFLVHFILQNDLHDLDYYIGSLEDEEPPTQKLHEISIEEKDERNLVIVRLRLLAKLGTPTYYAVVGKYCGN